MSDRRKSRTKSYSKSKSTSRSRSRSHSADSRRRSRSYSRDRDRRSRSRSSDRHRDSDRAPNTKPSNVLSVFGLGAYTSERDLKDAFGKYGRVTDVKIIYDGKTGRSRGFGFIYFNKTEEASVAKEELHGHDLDGHKIRVEFSITRKPHNPTPGIYMGYTNNRYYRRSPYRGSSRRSPRYSRYSRSRSRSYEHRHRRSPSPYYR